MNNKIFVTSALPYCNNIPHLGNIIGSTLSGDVYSRFKKIQGYDVLYLCGIDCYGTTTEIKAREENLSCENICQKYGKLHKNIYDWFNINFDVWGSTINKNQTELTQTIFLNLYKNGFIEEKKSIQMYCQNCDMFLADRYLKGLCYHKECLGKKNMTNGDQCDKCQKFINVTKIINPFCYICKNSPFLKETEHLYLKLGNLSDEIKKFNFEDPKISMSDQSKSIIKSWFDLGLESRCITRDLKWGTPIPWQYDNILNKYKNKVFYVWFDAVFSYFSILMNAKDNWKEWITNDIKWILFMGIDNLPYHLITFAGSILGSKLDLPLPKKIYSIPYLMYEGRKFSKSNNIGIFGNQVIEISNKLDINEDYWRFYLVKIRPENNIASFDWNEFLNIIKCDLVNNIGNFINRCFDMIEKFCYNEVLYTPNNELEIFKFINSYVDSIENFSIRNSLNICLGLSTYGNTFLQSNKPWLIFKTKDIILLNLILGKAIMICYTLLYLLFPIIPKITYGLLNRFEFNDKINNIDDLKNKLSTSFKIKINKINYSLPFKNLDKNIIKNVLIELNIKSNIY